MNKLKKLWLVLAVLMIAGIFSGCGAAARRRGAEQSFPTRAIEMVVPFGPGGSSDIMSRQVAQLMMQFIDTPVNVVNRAGGGSTDGMVYAFNQPADGYTLLQITPSIPIIQSQGRAPINFTEQFIPIGNFQVDINVIGIHQNNPNFRTFDEMIDFARRNPGVVRMGGQSPGGLDDFIVRAFGEAAGIELLFIPYNSTAETKAAFLGGEIDLYQDRLISFIQMIQLDEVVPVLVLYDRRLTEIPELANVPSSVELGINFTQGSWRGYAVKRGTPPEIVSFLENLLKQAYDSPEYKTMAERDGSDIIPGYMNAADYERFINEQLVRFRTVFGR